MIHFSVLKGKVSFGFPASKVDKLYCRYVGRKTVFFSTFILLMVAEHVWGWLLEHPSRLAAGSWSGQAQRDHGCVPRSSVGLSCRVV